MSELAPHIARQKERLLGAPYEVCLARAHWFTEAYRETEGLHPALRNAAALRRTLERQRISIYADERLAGTRTERFLASPLSVERGDFLRAVQLELDVLHEKRQPFFMSERDRRRFREEILPYWDGRTVRDAKARGWQRRGLVAARPGPVERVRQGLELLRLARQLGRGGLRRVAGAGWDAPLTRQRRADLSALRYEYAFNNPTPALVCFDVQGHLCLGVDKVVRHGMATLVRRAEARLERLRAEHPDDHDRADFLRAVVASLEAAIAYAGRFARLADRLAAVHEPGLERERLQRIAEHLRRVPAKRPRTFHEALQAAWFAQVVGEIQYGSHDVFGQGRADQYLLPFYRADLRAGRLDEPAAVALIQEWLLKLSANVEPIPELGMEANGVLGNSQHNVTIGGVRPDGRDGTNELSWRFLEAYEQLGGTVNQLCVRLHERTPGAFLRRTLEVFRRSNGLALYNDGAVVPGLRADGMRLRDARDYNIVGCVETSGQSDTHGCPGGQELVLPAVLMLALTGGASPPRAPGQRRGPAGRAAAAPTTFAHVVDAFHAELVRQIRLLVAAVAEKDEAHRRHLPAPYVSALMDGCLESGRDITEGGARYDFTSLDVRGLATTVDSLLAIEACVFDWRLVTLPELLDVLAADFAGHEGLRARLLRETPRYGTGDERADRLALSLLERVATEAARHRNVRGGRLRCCYYSYGNHVIDGLFLGATPDGRRKGTPISNGCSPSNLAGGRGGPLGALRAVARFPPEQVSSGVSLNLRFHPQWLRSDRGLAAFGSMIRTYFGLGGMHLQPNVVSTETLRAAQQDPDGHRDLVVKVAGYSAYFTDLGMSIQDDIIARTEHSP